MNNSKFINTLVSGTTVNKFTCILKEIKLQESSNGSKYYSVTLQDKTGEIKGKIWGDRISRIKDIELFTNGNIIEIDGAVQSYLGNLQFIVSDMFLALDVDFTTLMPSGKIPQSETLKILYKFVEKIDDVDIKNLVQNIFSGELLNKFIEAPAAMVYHHAFVGGLLEHVVEMLELSVPYQSWYPNANFNIVWAGIMLHDIGKIEEIKREGASFTFSTKGKLLGHINIGIELVFSHLPENFPMEKWMQIQHIMISHHRELEYGAAVVPSSIEAGIVSVCDLGSSWIREFDQAINDSINSGKEFSDYKKTIGAAVYLKSNSKSNIEHEKFEQKDKTSDHENSPQLQLF